MAAGPDSSSALIRVLIADESLIYTQLLTASLQANADFRVTGCECEARVLLREVSSQIYDVVVMSLHTDETPSRTPDTVVQMRIAQPATRIVILLESSKREAVLEAFRCGANGVFSRNQSVDVLARCVRKVHEGQVWANTQQLSYLMEAFASTPVVRAVDAKGLDLLTKREFEIVSSLARGLTNREIADQLSLSQHTVKNYIFRIFEKLGVSNRVELLFLTLQQSGRVKDSQSDSRKRIG